MTIGIAGGHGVTPHPTHIQTFSDITEHIRPFTPAERYQKDVEKYKVALDTLYFVVYVAFEQALNQMARPPFDRLRANGPY